MRWIAAMWRYMGTRRETESLEAIYGSRDRVWAWYTWAMCLGFLGAISIWWLFIVIFLIGFVAAVLSAIADAQGDYRKEESREKPE